MNLIADLLNRFPVLILDGAMATELERRGCDLRDPLWSAKVLLEAPELIWRVHSDYFCAGADIAITASYQATVDGFMRRGLGREESLDLLRRSVRLALEARDAFWREPANRIGRPRPLVAASVGPYGAFLADGSEYRGDYGLSEAELMDFHRPRMTTLLEAGPDLLACETLPCFVEARALVRLLAEFPDVSAWISFSARDDSQYDPNAIGSDGEKWIRKELHHRQFGLEWLRQAVLRLDIAREDPKVKASIKGQPREWSRKLVVPIQGLFKQHPTARDAEPEESAAAFGSLPQDTRRVLPVNE